MTPKDKEFYAAASKLLAKIGNMLSPGHRVTLIVREVNSASGFVMSSEETEEAETAELLCNAIRKSLSRKPSAIISIPDPPSFN